MDALLTEHGSNLFSVFHRGTENHSALVPNVLHPCIYNQLIPLRNKDFAFQIPNIVLDTVEPYFC